MLADRLASRLHAFVHYAGIARRRSRRRKNARCGGGILIALAIVALLKSAREALIGFGFRALRRSPGQYFNGARHTSLSCERLKNGFKFHRAARGCIN